ncbi:MAG: hypothetical protein IPH57_03065 [Saprospiraceae bacterium]|nr:hypothetical protein [Saprospiraceae bacterium]
MSSVSPKSGKPTGISAGTRNNPKDNTISDKKVDMGKSSGMTKDDGRKSNDTGRGWTPFGDRNKSSIDKASMIQAAKAITDLTDQLIQDRETTARVPGIMVTRHLIKSTTMIPTGIHRM